MKLIRAIGALATTFALVVGIPWLLIAAVGNPIPDEGLHWDGPITNDLILGAMAAIAWVFWVQVVVCLAIETVAEVRVLTGRSAHWMDRVPGTFAGQQQVARVLVHSVAAIGIGAAVASSPVREAVAPMSTIVEAVPPATTVHSPPQPHAAADVGESRTRPVVVAKGDSLWSLAETHLGHGERWREIADLNQGRRMGNGRVFVSASVIEPGWVIQVPSESVKHEFTSTGGATLHVVERDESLWRISEEEYGDGGAWPRIYQANNDVIDDPSLIYPGQRLDIPRNQPRDRVAPDERPVPDVPDDPTAAAPDVELPAVTEPPTTAPPSAAPPVTHPDDQGAGTSRTHPRSFGSCPAVGHSWPLGH